MTNVNYFPTITYAGFNDTKNSNYELTVDPFLTLVNNCQVHSIGSRDQCYDFKKILPKIGRKNWRFTLETKLNNAKF
jgi:hypothetical protein